MIKILQSLHFFINSSSCLFGITLASLLFKIVVLYQLAIQSKKGQLKNILSIIALCAVAVDISWLVSLFSLLTSNISYHVELFVIQFAWIATLILYQAFAIFIEHITFKHTNLTAHQKITCCISIILTISLLLSAIIDARIFTIIRNMSALFGIIVASISCFIAMRATVQQSTPPLFKKQLKMLIMHMVAPLLLIDFCLLLPIIFPATGIIKGYIFIEFSTFLMSYTLFYCLQNFIDPASTKKDPQSNSALPIN